MKSLIIILFAALTVYSTQAQQDETKDDSFLGSISFKNNEVFKRSGVFATANVLYYHSNLGIGFDCFLFKNFSANIEIAFGESYGQEESIYIQEIDAFINLKYINYKASLGLKYWPITRKTKNNIYPYFGVNFALAEVQFNVRNPVFEQFWEVYMLRSNVIETPIGLCYYKDGFQLAAHVGVFMDGKWGLQNLTARDIYPFMSLQLGYRF